jgi:mono/diheme cytochrome c family protein
MSWTLKCAAALAGAIMINGVARAAPPSVAEWDAPSEARLRPNALSATNAEHVKRGRSLFMKHCVTCHGNEGRGDGPSARLHARRSGYAPRDLSREDLQQSLTDGEMFWKLTNGWRPGGKTVMPGLGDELSEEDRWRIVLYVRSLAPKGGIR